MKRFLLDWAMYSLMVAAGCLLAFLLGWFFGYGFVEGGSAAYAESRLEAAAR